MTLSKSSSAVPQSLPMQDDLMSQTDSALMRSQLLLDELASSGLFDDVLELDVESDWVSEPEHVKQISVDELSEESTDPAKWSDAPGMVKLPIALLEALTEMWRDMQESKKQCGESVSRASTCCPSPSDSTASLHSLLSSPSSTGERAELIEELRQLLQESLSPARAEPAGAAVRPASSFSFPTQTSSICQRYVSVPFVPVQPVRYQQVVAVRPVLVSRIRRSFLC